MDRQTKKEVAEFRRAMREHERKALREHAEAHYGEQMTLKDWAKVVAGVILVLPPLYVCTVVILSL